MIHNTREFIKRNFERNYLNFRKYVAIGAIFSLLEIFSLWVFIDIMKKPTLAYSIMIIGALTMLKFYSYVIAGMMKNRIFGYMFVLGVFYILNVVFIWLLVEVIGLSAALSSAFLAAAFFILRFLTYDKVKLLKY